MHLHVLTVYLVLNETLLLLLIRVFGARMITKKTILSVNDIEQVNCTRLSKQVRNKTCQNLRVELEMLPG
jgi:hypothetical protein